MDAHDAADAPSPPTQRTSVPEDEPSTADAHAGKPGGMDVDVEAGTVAGAEAAGGAHADAMLNDPIYQPIYSSAATFCNMGEKYTIDATLLWRDASQEIESAIAEEYDRLMEGAARSLSGKLERLQELHRETLKLEAKKERVLGVMHSFPPTLEQPPPVRA